MAATLGRLGEDIAETYLERCLGWTVIRRNERTRHGELDIVAVDGRTIVFVEVKTRSSARYGLPIDAVTSSKLHKLTCQVENFLAKHAQYRDYRICLDVISLLVVQNQLVSFQHVRVLPEAF